MDETFKLLAENHDAFTFRNGFINNINGIDLITNTAESIYRPYSKIVFKQPSLHNENKWYFGQLRLRNINYLNGDIRFGWNGYDDCVNENYTNSSLSYSTIATLGGSGTFDSVLNPQSVTKCTIIGIAKRIVIEFNNSFEIGEILIKNSAPSNVKNIIIRSSNILDTTYNNVNINDELIFAGSVTLRNVNEDLFSIVCPVLSNGTKYINIDYVDVWSGTDVELDTMTFLPKNMSAIPGKHLFKYRDNGDMTYPTSFTSGPLYATTLDDGPITHDATSLFSFAINPSLKLMRYYFGSTCKEFNYNLPIVGSTEIQTSHDYNKYTSLHFVMCIPYGTTIIDVILDGDETSLGFSNEEYLFKDKIDTTYWSHSLLNPQIHDSIPLIINASEKFSSLIEPVTLDVSDILTSYTLINNALLPSYTHTTPNVLPLLNYMQIDTNGSIIDDKAYIIENRILKLSDILNDAVDTHDVINDIYPILINQIDDITSNISIYEPLIINMTSIVSDMSNNMHGTLLNLTSTYQDYVSINDNIELIQFNAVELIDSITYASNVIDNVNITNKSYPELLVYNNVNLHEIYSTINVSIPLIYDKLLTYSTTINDIINIDSRTQNHIQSVQNILDVIDSIHIQPIHDRSIFDNYLIDLTNLNDDTIMLSNELNDLIGDVMLVNESVNTIDETIDDVNDILFNIGHINISNIENRVESICVECVSNKLEYIENNILNMYQPFNDTYSVINSTSIEFNTYLTKTNTKIFSLIDLISTRIN